mgnify:CR=1 FL=1
MTILRARKLAEEYKSLSVLGKDPKLVQEKKQEDSPVVSHKTKKKMKVFIS